MKVSSKAAAAAVSLVFGAMPALALAHTPPSHPNGPPSTVTTGQPSTTPPANQGTAHKPTTSSTTGQPSTTPPINQGTAHKPSTPGPSASLPAKAKAYGRYCQGESKQHVAGQKGTPFSQCVTAMAKAATHKAKSPQAACKSESKKHVTGQKGTPFSLCVSGAAKLLKQQSSSSSTTTS